MEVETCRVRIQWLGVEIIKPPFGNYIFFLTATVNDGPSYTFRHPVKATESPYSNRSGIAIHYSSWTINNTCSSRKGTY